MSNPWPTQPWPQTPLMQSQHTILQQPKPQSSLTAALLQWENAKKALAAAKEAEMHWRKEAFAAGFGADAKEGTNTVALENGYELKGVKKLNYNLKAPENYKGTTLDAVEECMEHFEAISNEGSFIADRLFKWSVDMSLSEYRGLVSEAEYSPVKKKLLDEVNKVLEITEAAPTLEIKESKRAKK